jgi:Protein of unknown function (DUF 659)/hAT family C-terminal dimerisation region
MANLPFTTFEDPFGKAFLRSLNPAYNPPSRKTIAGPLLNTVYENIKSRTDELIGSFPNINITTDESSNINRTRICNISIHSDHGSLHYLSEDIRAKRMTAPASAEWLRNHLLALSDNNLRRINSVATDTCDTMYKMWTELQRFPDLKHTLFVPCNSHSIQLLIKDLLKIPRFKDVLHKAQTIVKAFKKAPLQYARLREIQIQAYSQPRSLVLSVITRWGTQYRLLDSVFNNKDALRRYAVTYEQLPTSQRLKQSALDAIMDWDFWSELEPMREFLFPIDEALKMSESGKANIGQVFHSWMDITKHLRDATRQYPDELEVFMLPEGAFSQRYRRQILDIHIVSYYLLPENRTQSITLQFDQQITAFFNRYSSSPEEAATLHAEFDSFRAQFTPFESARRFWSHTENPKLFWHSASSHTQFLGQLAFRLFSLPVNSVASEQAFSIQNLIHSKIRSALQSERVDKLTYTYINGRVLYNIDKIMELGNTGKSKRPSEMTIQDEVLLEDVFLAIEQEERSSATIINEAEDEEEDSDDDEDDDE